MTIVQVADTKPVYGLHENTNQSVRLSREGVAHVIEGGNSRSCAYHSVKKVNKYSTASAETFYGFLAHQGTFYSRVGSSEYSYWYRCTKVMTGVKSHK